MNLSLKQAKPYLKTGYRLRRRSWPKGKFIFCTTGNTIKDQDFKMSELYNSLEDQRAVDWMYFL